MYDIIDMRSLVDKLNEASKAYYNGKDEIMSNKEFDEMFNQLKQMEAELNIVFPDSPTHNVGYTVVDSLPKFKHPYPALSLDKTKDIAEFRKRFEDGVFDSGSDNDGVVLMWKLDGSTVQAYYNEGKLQRLVTRGNGEIGSDITHNAKAINGIPLRISHAGELVVRGEAMMSYKDFDKINSELPEDQRYKNPRNLAAASIQMLDSNEVVNRRIVVKAFNLVKYEGDNEPTTFSDRLNMLDELGFQTVERILQPVCYLDEAVMTMSLKVDDYSYPVDGLVAALDNYTYASTLEGTEHHPNIMQGYAFKWSDETAETVLKKIEWSPSRTGLMNPVAIFDPVELEGTTVQRASVHNVSIVRQLNLHVGDRITVYKSNKIIPQIDQNLDVDKHIPYSLEELIDLVGYCPTCGEKIGINVSPEGIETAFCPNTNCPEKMIGKLAHFCERDCMDIQGMSEETIKKLVDAGFIKEYVDFFKLDQKPGISFLPGFGKQSWKKMCEAAEKAKTTDFVKFITALSIPNIGKGQAKTLLKYINDNYDSIMPENAPYNPEGALLYMVQTHFDFTKIEGFGNVIDRDLKVWIQAHMLLDPESPEMHVYKELVFYDKRPDRNDNQGAIAGKSFCITGKLIKFSNRQALVDVIESHGGKWIDSVSSKTDYLINNDVESTSGKNKKAKELNIPIISEDYFLDMIEK